MIKSLYEAGYSISKIDGDEYTLQDTEYGGKEVWIARDDAPASYCIEVDNKFLEFCYSLKH